MSPEEMYNTSPIPGSDSTQSKKQRLLITGVIVIGIVLLAFLIFGHRGPKFSISRTEPSLTAMTTQSTSLKVDFNEPLASGSASVSSNPSIVHGTSISGDTLTLTIPPKTLLSTQTYTVTINSIRSSSGKQLKDQQLSFRPKYAAPKITGEDGLINIGLTSTQVSDINTDISQFKPWALSVTIDKSSIKHYMENPSDPWSPWAASFSANIDGTDYTFVGDFYSTQDIRIKITDPASGQLLFTAGTPGSV